MKPVLRLASEQDDAELRILFREVAMDGNVRICFEREPNYFRAIQPQGDVRQTVVCIDKDTGILMGAGSRSVSNGYINGRRERIAYLSDLRVREKYRGSRMLVRAYHYLKNLEVDHPATAVYTVVFADNEKALSTIAQGRAGLPKYHDRGFWECAAIRFGKKSMPRRSGAGLSWANKTDLPSIVDFLNRENRVRPLAPCHSVEDFSKGNRWEGMDPQSICLAKVNHEIVGTLGVWDQHSFKQSRVAGYSPRMKWTAWGSRVAAPILGGPALPKEGRCLRYLSSCFAAARDRDVFSDLINRVRDEFRGGDSLYLFAGFHERDPLLAAAKEFRHTPFRGRLFTVGESEPVDIGEGIPYIENVSL